MHELQAIVNAAATAHARGEHLALATITHVEGSAYRRAGARMLITESGHTIGSLSGGCLERDVAEQAITVIRTGQPHLIEYDTRGDSDLIWGLGLGCHGIIQILLESLTDQQNAALDLKFIAACLDTRESGVLAKILPTDSRTHSIRYQRHLFFDQSKLQGGSDGGTEFERAIREEAKNILLKGQAEIRSYETAEGRIEIFFDVVMPPRALVIFGAEHDAVPVVKMAKMVGWHVTLVDTRARQLSIGRFSEADAVKLCRAEEITEIIGLTPETAVVVMTHNFQDDVVLLRKLLPSPIKYLGLLGSKIRTTNILAAVKEELPTLAASQVARLHSPIGVDVGAETPQEIALAIIAEIQAVGANRRAGFLSDRGFPIHTNTSSKIKVAVTGPINNYVTTRKTAFDLTCPLS